MGTDGTQHTGFTGAVGAERRGGRNGKVTCRLFGKQCPDHLSTNGATPARPLLCSPRRRLLGGQGCEARAGRPGLGIGPRATQPVGSASPLQAGSLHFQGRGSNNKMSGAAAQARLPGGAPRIPCTPGYRGLPARGPCHAPTPHPGPVPCTARGGRSSPQAHLPAHRNPPTPARKDPRPSASRGEGKPGGPSHRENLAPGVRAGWAAAP